MILGNAGYSSPAHAGFFRRKAFFTLVLVGLPSIALAWVPLVELKFEPGTTTSTANTGSTGGTATLSSPTPAYVSNTAISGGAKALDFGSTDGNFFADMSSAAVKNLKSFTISGWVNCRLDNTNYGGGRIVSWFKDTTGYGGVDLAFRSGGRLGLGVNQYNDVYGGGVLSSPSKIIADPNVSYNNWRFFAVTYDGTVTSNNVKFYFGTNNVPASLDGVAMDYNQGAIKSNVAPTLTVGNVPSHHRAHGFYAPFHGLIDQVRIYGSTSNNSGVLTLDQIQSLQGALSLANVPGVIYEQWNDIEGDALSALTCDPRFLNNNPSLTKLQGNFEGFDPSGDKYGARVSGWVKAPVTGPYQFFIVADNSGELRLSTDVNPATKRLIASVSTYNSSNTNWTEYGSQTSEPVELQAGQYYYVEALMKQGWGANFVRVGWKLPSGVLEQPIPQSRLVTTPPDGVPFYPSQYPVYEAGTFVKKASMGWEKEAGNDHFYIKTDETEALTAKNGTTIIPKRLFFGGGFPNDPNQNDLGFRWDRDNEGTIGHLYLQTQQDEHWAMSVEARSEMEPHVEFNQFVNVTGPNFHEGDVEDGFTWEGFATMDYFNGTYFERRRVSDANPDQTNEENSLLNGGGLLLTSTDTRNSLVNNDTATITSTGIYLTNEASYNPQKTTLSLNSGGLTYEINENNMLVSRTIIDQEGVTTPRVTTSMWKVAVPDYVFEKGYPLRSLEETERFVKEKKHLPEIPSAKEMTAKGLDLTEMNMQLLKKVEELTLHMISMNKELKALKAERRPGARGVDAERALRAGKGK